MSEPQPTAANRLLKSPEAAAFLAICEKTLWTLKKNGEIRAVYFGRAVRYAIADLEAFIAKRSSASV
jgi:predicted DNA-binding transcriptional regulator AlpA